MVGPPPPVFCRAAGSVMPNPPVSSAPEYVVGMAMWGNAGRSANDAPGVPDSCSVKKHTALPMSAHEPPPNETTASTASRRACCTARCTNGTGTCDSASANVDASVDPSALRTRAPSSESCRPSVVTRNTRRAPSALSNSPTLVTVPAPKTSCCAKPVCVHGRMSEHLRDVGFGGHRHERQRPAIRLEHGRRAIPDAMAHDALVCRGRADGGVDRDEMRDDDTRLVHTEQTRDDVV